MHKYTGTQNIHIQTVFSYPVQVIVSRYIRGVTPAVLSWHYGWLSPTQDSLERDPDYPTFVLSHRETYKWLGPEGGLHMCVCVRECVDLGKWFSISVAGFNQLLNHQRNY